MRQILHHMRVEDGRTGISDPRIPKQFERPDYCPR